MDKYSLKGKRILTQEGGFMTARTDSKQRDKLDK